MMFAILAEICGIYICGVYVCGIYMIGMMRAGWVLSAEQVPGLGACWCTIKDARAAVAAYTKLAQVRGIKRPF